MNRPLTSNENESVIKKLSKNKSLGPDGITSELYQTLRDKLTLILLKLSQKISEEGTFQNSLYDIIFSVIPKSDKDITKIETCWPIAMMNIDAKIFNKILAN